MSLIRLQCQSRHLHKKKMERRIRASAKMSSCNLCNRFALRDKLLVGIYRPYKCFVYSGLSHNTHDTKGQSQPRNRLYTKLDLMRRNMDLRY